MGAWRCPPCHDRQLSCWEEQISSSLLAILNAECSSQTLRAFVLSVVHFTLSVGFQSSERTSGLFNWAAQILLPFVECRGKEYE